MQEVVENSIIKAVLQDGISQVDENLTIDDFECVFDTTTRKLRIHLTVINSETDETLEIDNAMG